MQSIFLKRPDVSPPDKLPSLRYPRLANITIHRSGPESTIDLYWWVSKHPSSTLLHMHVGATGGEDAWLRMTNGARHDLDPLPTFAAWLFQYVPVDLSHTRSFADVTIGTFSLRASDYRISPKIRDELSRMVRPLLSEIQAENDAVAGLVAPAPIPARLTLIRDRADR